MAAENSTTNSTELAQLADHSWSVMSEVFELVHQAHKQGDLRPGLFDEFALIVGALYAVRADARAAVAVVPRGPERSVGRGRSAPAKRSPN